MPNYDWDWLKDKTPESVGVDLAEDTSTSQVLIVRGEEVVVYDLELAIMIARQWASQGMTRTEIEDLFLEKIPE